MDLSSTFYNIFNVLFRDSPLGHGSCAQPNSQIAKLAEYLDLIWIFDINKHQQQVFALSSPLFSCLLHFFPFFHSWGVHTASVKISLTWDENLWRNHILKLTTFGTFFQLPHSASDEEYQKGLYPMIIFRDLSNNSVMAVIATGLAMWSKSSCLCPCCVSTVYDNLWWQYGRLMWLKFFIPRIPLLCFRNICWEIFHFGWMFGQNILVFTGGWVGGCPKLIFFHTHNHTL